MIYSCDFETSYSKKEDGSPDKTWVYVWGAKSEKGFEYGRDIQSFINWMKKLETGEELFFHNLKFDGTFILSYLLPLPDSYLLITEEEELLNENIGKLKYITKKKFKELETGILIDPKINSMGIWYSITIHFKEASVEKRIKIHDSLKLLNMSVKEIGEKFLGLPKEEGKLKYDYDLVRYPDTPLTEKELKYLEHDCDIVYKGIKALREDFGVEKWTAASAALCDFRMTLNEIIEDLNYENKDKDGYRLLFPVLENRESEVASLAYKGGLCYVASDKAGNTYGTGSKKIGFTIDANSLYPSVMIDEENIFPVGYGKYFEGIGIETQEYPLFIQVFSCVFKLKKHKLPMVNFKLKDKKLNMTCKTIKINELLTSSNGEHLLLCMTNIDLRTFLKNYDVIDLEFHYGYKYRGVTGIFEPYISKWQKVKIEAVKEKNKVKKGVSKIFQNSLYGKFGTKYEKVSWKLCYVNNGKLEFISSVKKDEEPQYMPLAAFITSYARRELIKLHDIIVKLGYCIYDETYYSFSYCDTDSLHCLVEFPFDEYGNIKKEYEKEYEENKELFEELKYYIDDSAYGKWKKEEDLYKVKYIRAKTYLEQVVSNEEKEEKEKLIKEMMEKEDDIDLSDEKYKIYASACAGLPKEIQQKLNFDNFEVGVVYDDVKLMPVNVSGGCVLVRTSFKIKGEEEPKNERKKNSKSKTGKCNK